MQKVQEWQDRPAAVTIGMPLYNNAATISRAIHSLQRQTRGDFRLIASDDGSRDETTSLVAQMARLDPRISLMRQPNNLNYGNFRYVLQAAESPYFMFAAGDDWWEPEFLERCIAALGARPDAICAVPHVLMHPAHGDPYLSPATFALDESVSRNVARYLWGPGDNSRMYGLFLTDVAQRAFPPADHFAYDWTFCASSLSFGTHVEVPQVLLHRELTPPERYVEYVRRDARNPIHRLLPLLAMTWRLLTNGQTPRTRPVLRALLNLNLRYHVDYMKRYHPRTAVAYGWLERAVSRARGRTSGRGQEG